MVRQRQYRQVFAQAAAWIAIEEGLERPRRQALVTGAWTYPVDVARQQAFQGGAERQQRCVARRDVYHQAQGLPAFEGAIAVIDAPDRARGRSQFTRQLHAQVIATAEGDQRLALILGQEWGSTGRAQLFYERLGAFEHAVARGWRGQEVGQPCLQPLQRLVQGQLPMQLAVDEVHVNSP